MRSFIPFICILLITCYSYAQGELEINQSSNLLDVDNKGDIYLVNDTELLKYNQNGDLLYRYSNSLNGSITSIDVTNPLRILLFYQESNVIVFLNQQLATITDAIQINDLSSVEAIVASASSKGGFWAYDALTMTLLFFDSNRILQKQSVNLSGYLNGEEPTFMIEQMQLLYLQTQSKILVFDIYSNLINIFPFASKNKIKVRENNIHTLDTLGITKYNLLSKEKTVFNLKDYSNYTNAFLIKNRLILQTANGVKIINLE